MWRENPSLAECKIPEEAEKDGEAHERLEGD